MKVVIDFESRSAVTELNRTGPWPYAEHPSTGIWCLAVKINNSPPVLWVPKHVYSALPENCALPMYDDSALRQVIEGADTLECHNVQFEMAIWHHIMSKRYGFPDLPLHKLRDTAAVAAMHALPRKLEKAVEVMGTHPQKDMEGHALMLKMSKPRAPRKAEWAELDAQFLGCPEYRGLKDAYFESTKEKTAAMCLFAARNWTNRMADMLLWHEDPADIERLCRYCLQDVEAEYALGQALGELPDMELPIFQHDLVINTRGIQVDIEMVDAALAMIKEHERRLLIELDTLTSGTVRTPKQVQASTAWLASRGVKLDDMTADTVKATLKLELPDDARRFLEIRQSLAKSSTAKYEAAKHMTCSDGRLRGFSMYHGAGTGRWAGKGIQLQNLPRGVFDLGQKPDKNGRKPSEEAFWHAVELVRAGNLDALTLEFGDPMPILSSVIRPLLMATDGCELMADDFSAIEGRGLAWLAGEQWVLEAYEAYDRGEGPDMYMVTAGKILGKPATEVTKTERKSPGKIADLACGYFGGPRAIAAFNGECPKEDRPKWIVEWIRRELRDNEETLTVFKQWLDDFSGVPVTETVLLQLKANGWPYPTEDELFEIWARDVVNKWRESRPMTVALWKGLEAAAVLTVETGEPHAYRGITYSMKGVFLTCTLPSGRPIYYPFPKLAQREMTWGGSKLQLSHMTVDATTKQWVRRFAHGGVLTENVNQAVCRDIMAEALLRLERDGFPIILHVHDEAVGEVPTGARTLEEFTKVMTVVPAWADGFPISASGWVGARYRKD